MAAKISYLRLVLAAFLIIVTSAILRILYILPLSSRFRYSPRRKHPKTKSRMLVVLGSGGHTAEMMSLLGNVDPRRYAHRTYIVSSGDKFSKFKALEIERELHRRCGQTFYDPTEEALEADSVTGSWNSITGIWEVEEVPRARKIHQSKWTTPFSSFWCLLGCIRVLVATSQPSTTTTGAYPDVIITNGPATAVMVILAATVLKFCGVAPVWKMKIIYVESWARVKSLSLSGRVLLYMGVCDEFLVQWESLARSINGIGARQKVKWKGFLVE